MGAKKALRPGRAALHGNRNIFQKGSSRRQCVSARCKAVAAQAERYRALNEELVRENAALRAVERTNRDFSVMFDRFLLKMGQSTPYVQGLKKHLEIAYDNLGQIETMIDCFSDGNSLRRFLLGEESFMFEPVRDDAKDSPRSPLVKQAPPRDHRQFNDDGEIDTIIEADEENVAMNSSQVDRTVVSKPSTHCIETPAIPQRRSSRRSSVGIPGPTPRAFSDQSHHKIPSDTSATRSSMTSSKSPNSVEGSEQTSSFEKRTESRPRRSSNTFSNLPSRRLTYVKGPELPKILVTNPESRNETLRIDETMDLEDKHPSSPQIPGKSDGELSRCFERTMTETELPSIEPPQIQERSPTAINVAQIWAKANALGRSPSDTTGRAVLWPPVGPKAAATVDSRPISPSADPLATTQFPSPVLCERESSLPTSTPALNKADCHPTAPPEVSIIVADVPELQPSVLRNVDCRRRKPILTNRQARESPPQFATSIPKSIRFSLVPDDFDAKDKTVLKSTVSKASVSSPFVKRARNTTVRPQKVNESEKAQKEESSDRENGDLRPVETSEEPGTSSQPRKTYVKKRAPSRPSIAQPRKRTQPQSSKVDSVTEAIQQSNDTGNNSTLTADNIEPTPKRVRRTAEQTKDTPRISSQRSTSSRTSRETSSSIEDSSSQPRRVSRRAAGVSYAEPSLRTKMRRD